MARAIAGRVRGEGSRDASVSCKRWAWCHNDLTPLVILDSESCVLVSKKCMNVYIWGQLPWISGNFKILLKNRRAAVDSWEMLLKPCKWWDKLYINLLKPCIWWDKLSINPVNNGINYQPQLVSLPDFWPINRTIEKVIKPTDAFGSTPGAAKTSTLPKFKIAPEKIPKPNRKGLSFQPSFFQWLCLTSGGVMIVYHIFV